MSGLKERVAVGAAALVLLMVSLPSDEGVRYTPYKDVGGVLTVCYGHTGSDIVMKTYSKQECLDLLEKDTKRHIARVQSCTTRIPTAYQLAGFSSMDFNTGQWCGSRSMREFNLGNDIESCRAMAYGPSGQKVWGYVKGVFWESVHKRRIREMNQCLQGLS